VSPRLRRRMRRRRAQRRACLRRHRARARRSDPADRHLQVGRYGTGALGAPPLGTECRFSRPRFVSTHSPTPDRVDRGRRAPWRPSSPRARTRRAALRRSLNDPESERIVAIAFSGAPVVHVHVLDRELSGRSALTELALRALRAVDRSESRPAPIRAPAPLRSCGASEAARTVPSGWGSRPSRSELREDDTLLSRRGKQAPTEVQP